MREFKIENDFILCGYRCVVVGQNLGHRCGYIGFAPNHPLYGKDYDYVNNIDLPVHGGWTFSDDGDGIYPVESNLWWIGFDCIHYGDGKDMELVKELASEREYKAMMQMENMFPTKDYETVRTKEYVENELIDAVKKLNELFGDGGQL